MVIIVIVLILIIVILYNIISLNILVHDMINLLYYIMNTEQTSKNIFMYSNISLDRKKTDKTDLVLNSFISVSF